MKFSPVKEFFRRGMSFGGFGPIICGMVFLILSFTLEGFTLTGTQVFVAILSTYLLAFVHAGASVFHQVESWSLAKSLLCHLGTLYFSYILCYIVNSWIPFEPIALLIFTGSFVVGYLVIWLIIYLCIKVAARRLNQKLH